MGFRDSVDNWVHGGVPKPESYERKKLYSFGEELGTFTHTQTTSRSADLN